MDIDTREDVMRRGLLASALIVTATIASTLVLASPASADPITCPWDPTGKCAYVLAEELNVREAPSTSASIVGTRHLNDLVEIHCWTTGSYVNGYNIWVKLDNPLNSPEYVSDYYLSTGYVQSFIAQC